MKIIFRYILLVCFVLWCIIIFLYTIKTPEQVQFKERNELLYRNDSDTLKQTNYFTND